MYSFKRQVSGDEKTNASNKRKKINNDPIESQKKSKIGDGSILSEFDFMSSIKACFLSCGDFRDIFSHLNVLKKHFSKPDSKSSESDFETSNLGIISEISRILINALTRSDTLTNAEKKKLEFFVGVKSYRGKRIKSAKQISILKKYFNLNPRPNRFEVNQLVESCSLSYDEIRVWFRAERKKLKRQGITIPESVSRIEKPETISKIESHKDPLKSNQCEPVQGFKKTRDYIQKRDKFIEFFNDNFQAKNGERGTFLRDFVRNCNKSDREIFRETLRSRGPYKSSGNPFISRRAILTRSRGAWDDLIRRFEANELKLDFYLNSNIVEGLVQMFLLHRDYFCAVKREIEERNKPKPQLTKLKSKVLKNEPYKLQKNILDNIANQEEEEEDIYLTGKHSLSQQTWNDESTKNGRGCDTKEDHLPELLDFCEQKIWNSTENDTSI